MKEALEKKLRKKQIVRRCVLAGLALVFLAMLIVSTWLLNSTAEVVEYDIGLGYTREDIIYNEAYIPFIVIGIVGAVTCAVYLLGDLVVSRFKTVEVNGHYVTVNRGLVAREVYLNGELKGSLSMELGYFIELTLPDPDQTRVSVAFGRAMLDSCFISFSNGRPTVEM